MYLVLQLHAGFGRGGVVRLHLVRSLGGGLML